MATSGRHGVERACPGALLTDRNRRWLPEIVEWLQSGKTYMVVAGNAHMAGSEGSPALLRAQGFRVEQL